MTSEIAADQSLAAVDSIRSERAQLLILDRAVRALLQAGHPLKAAQFTQVNGTQIFLGLVKEALYSQTLRSGDCVEAIGRLWDLKWRREVKWKPFGGLVLDVMKIVGKPLTSRELADIVKDCVDQEEESLVETIEEFLGSRLEATVFQMEDGRYGRLDWIPDVGGRSTEEALQLEFWGREAIGFWLVEQGRSLQASLGGRLNPSALLNAVGFPLSHREILFVLWASRQRKESPLLLLERALQDPHVHILSMGYWITPDVRHSLLAELSRQSEDLRSRYRTRTKKKEKTASAAAASVAPAYTLTSEDERELLGWMEQQPHPVETDRILEQVLEIVPGDPEYEAASRALEQTLGQDERFAAVGPSLWWLRDAIPQEVLTVPADLIPENPPPPPPERRQHFDLNLPLEAVEEDLRAFVLSPRYEDVQERAPAPEQPPSRVRRVEMAVTYPHLKHGTWVIPSDEISFFPPSGPVQFLWARDESGKTVPVWINLTERLAFGLKEWYQTHKVEVGSVLRMERTRDGAVLLRKVRRDAFLYRPRERLNELVAYAEHEAIRKAPVIVLLQTILSQFTGGLHFLTLWSEVNIIRRVSKLTIASVLCSYPMFARVAARSGFWTMDFSKITEGIKPEKAAYL